MPNASSSLAEEHREQWKVEQRWISLITALVGAASSSSQTVVGSAAQGMEGCVGRELAASLEYCGALMQQIGAECGSTWGAYEWVTDLHELDDHMEALRIDVMDTAYVGGEVKCDDDQVCVVQLSSFCRVVLLDALSLPSTAIQMHIQALFEDDWGCEGLPWQHQEPGVGA